MPLFLIGLCGLLVMVFKAPAAAPVKVTGNLLQMIGTGAGALYLGVAAGAFERDEPARQGWLRLALAMGANSLGFVVYGVMELAGAEELFPSVADFFWLITYPLALWAIIHLARQYCSSGLPMARPRLAVSAALVTLVVVGAVLLVPMVNDVAVPVWHRAILVSYPVGDVILIGAAAYMAELMSGFGRGALAWPWVAIVAGNLVLALTDIVYALLNLHDMYYTGHPIDGGWILSGVLMGLGGFLQWRIMARDLAGEGDHHAA